MIIDEIKNIKQSRKDLRKFGFTIGVVLLIIAGFLIWNQKNSGYYFLAVGVIIFMAGLFIPSILRPLNKAWMTLAILLGWVMTRVILSLLFYLIITPISLIARISGKHFLDFKIDKSRSSYWEKRNDVASLPENYERQF